MAKGTSAEIRVPYITVSAVGSKLRFIDTRPASRDGGDTTLMEGGKSSTGSITWNAEVTRSDWPRGPREKQRLIKGMVEDKCTQVKTNAVRWTRQETVGRRAVQAQNEDGGV